MAILFYDGVCGLCDRLVLSVLHRDVDQAFQFAPLQGETARRLVTEHGGDPTRLDTLYVLTRDGELLRRARAVLYVARRLGFPWNLWVALGILPTPLLDLGYRAIARVRHHLIPRRAACRLPSSTDAPRFLP